MAKILVVFYSRTGKTRQAATDIAADLGADSEEIIDQKNRKGLFGFLSGGRDAMKKNLTDIRPLSKDPAQYDLVIVGSPVWGGNLTPAVRTFLAWHTDKLRKFAFFITSDDTDPSLVAESAAQAAGKEPVAVTGWNTQDLKTKLTYKEKLALFTNHIRGII